MGLLQEFSLAFDNSNTRLKVGGLKKSKYQKSQLRDDFFRMKTKQKTVFALVPTQKLILLRCLSKAFDHSKIRFKKCLKIKMSNMQKKSTKSPTFFSIQAKPKLFRH